MSIAQKISELMDSRHLTNYRLAKELTIHPSTVSNWKDGVEPRKEHLAKVAKYFGVPVAFMLEEQPFLEWDTINSNRGQFLFNLRQAIRLPFEQTEFMGVSFDEPDRNDIPELTRLIDYFCKAVWVVIEEEGIRFSIEAKAAVEQTIQVGRNPKPPSGDAMRGSRKRLSVAEKIVGDDIDEILARAFPDGLIPIETKRVPLLGEIACGEPRYADEEFESYVECGATVQADFALRCVGDSMVNARIYDGDIVFIRAQPMVDDGEIAAVVIGDEATLKRYKRYGDVIVLSAENPQFKDIVIEIDEASSVHILGKAIAFQGDVK